MAALLAAAFAFAAETELERDAFELAKLCLERPDTLVPILLTESSGVGDRTSGGWR